MRRFALWQPEQKRATPTTVNFDTGAAGSSFKFKDFNFSDLAGTEFNGQSISLDILFTEFLVAPSISSNLFLVQDGGLGVIPNLQITVSSYWLDADGLQSSPETVLPRSGWMPGQLHPNWPYFLPDGRSYLPPNTSYGTDVWAVPHDRIDPNLGRMIDLDQMVFGGIHYDITFPDTANMLQGGRFSISNFLTPTAVLVSPDPIPDTFTIHVPDSGDTGLLLLCGVVAMIVMRTKAFAS